MKSATLSIEQMHCQACVKKVTDALHSVGGADVQQVTVGAAEVNYDPAKLSPQELVQAVTNAGFPAQVSKIANAD
jgi:copper chaperone